MPPGVSRGELIVLAFFLACGAVALLGRLGVLDLTGRAPLGLYPLYILAATAGWLNGNVFVARRRRGSSLWWMLAVYYLGPLAPLTLLRSMGGAASLQQAPLVPLFSAGVYSVFFLVPWSLRSTAAVRRDLTLLNHDLPDDEEGR
ncbi:MAG TPA: hypothetical protein VMT85_08790 [Thermoanaerobaculia bacterium]|nr:hypothetical protein [Thermoanaerobaculia bacterium]